VCKNKPLQKESFIAFENNIAKGVSFGGVVVGTVNKKSRVPEITPAGFLRKMQGE
jgi:hypothetical protein